MQRLIDPLGTWASPPPQQRPSFTGFLIWRDIEHRVSVLYPREWTVEEGVPVRVRTPNDAPHHATVTLQASRLPTSVEPDDVDALRDGIVAGVESIGGAVVERLDAGLVGALIDIEVEHTYRADQIADDGTPAVWRRWLRVMFQRDVHFMVSAEAFDGQAFDYWRPAFMSLMRMAKFADWTAEATGRSWESIDSDPGELGPTDEADA